MREGNRIAGGLGATGGKTGMVKPNIVLSGEFTPFEEVLRERFPLSRFFEAGETIYGFSDDRSKFCFYVVSGLVRCSYLTESGTQMILTMRGPGTIFPLYYTHRLTSIERTVEFVATKKTELLMIPKDELLRLMDDDHEFMHAMLDAWGEYATYLLYSSETRFDTVEQRVCGFLLLHGNGTGTVRMTHEAIAQVTGTTRENVSRAISDLQHAGIIVARRGSVTIKDRGLLEELAPYASTIG